LVDTLAGGGSRLPRSFLDLGLDEGMFEDGVPELRVDGAHARSLAMKSLVRLQWDKLSIYVVLRAGRNTTAVTWKAKKRQALVNVAVIHEACPGAGRQRFRLHVGKKPRQSLSFVQTRLKMAISIPVLIGGPYWQPNAERMPIEPA
jgi:hypothetical protein